MGRLESAGFSHARAMIWHTCSGVNFAGAPSRGASANRLAPLPSARPVLVAPTVAPEIRYRVAQRVAFLLSDDPTQRVRIAKRLKQAYDVRSGVVHAARSDTSATWDLMAVEVQELLRSCMKRI